MGSIYVLIDKSQSNTENILYNTKYMVDKYRKFSVRNGWKMVEQWFIELFENNSMKLNQDKRHLLVLEFKYKNVWPKIGKTNVRENKKQKLLGVERDRTLNFGGYVGSICKKDAQKWSVLARLSNLMRTNSFDGKSFDESMHWMTVWLLPFNLDVP